MAGGLVDEVGGLPNAYPGLRDRLVAAMHRDLPFGLLEGLGFGLLVNSAVIVVGSPKF
jgi:hypothetical protein